LSLVINTVSLMVQFTCLLPVRLSALQYSLQDGPKKTMRPHLSD